MNRRLTFPLLLALVALAALPAWAILVGCDDFFAQVGVRLGSGRIEIEEGQTIDATVGLPAVLSRHGLKAKQGDAVQVTFLRDNRFKLMHVPSGASVEITYRPKK